MRRLSIDSHDRSCTLERGDLTPDAEPEVWPMSVSVADLGRTSRHGQNIKWPIGPGARRRDEHQFRAVVSSLGPCHVYVPRVSKSLQEVSRGRGRAPRGATGGSPDEAVELIARTP